MNRATTSLAALAVVAAGCRFVPPNAAQKQVLLDQVAALERSLATEQAAYDAAIASSTVPRIAAIAEREQLRAGFTAAAEWLGKAKECTVTNFLDDDPLGEGESCSELVARADTSLRLPRRRIEDWTRLWSTAPAAAERARAAVARATTIVEAALDPQGSLVAAVATRRAAHPHKAADLDRRVAAIAAAPAELDRKLAAVDAELARSVDRTTDIAVLERVLGDLDTATAGVAANVAGLAKRVGELDVDEQTVLVRLEKAADATGFTFHATTRTYRDGVQQNELRAPIDGDTFTTYLAIATGLQRLFPLHTVIVTQPPVSLQAACAFTVNVEVAVVVRHKAVGQYADEASESPSPRGMALGYVGHPSYGAWQDDVDGRRSWRWNAVWDAYYPNRLPVAPVRDDVYGAYSAWRYDNGWACDFDRAGTFVEGGPLATASCRAGRVSPTLAALSCPGDEPASSAAAASIRGIGRWTRSRGMGGGGK